MALQAAIEGHLRWPWEFAASLGGATDYGKTLLRVLTDRSLWYVLGWLLPLGVWRLRWFPRGWVGGSAAAALAAVGLAVYADAAFGALARALFTVAGPLLSLSAAILLTGRGRNLVK